MKFSLDDIFAVIDKVEETGLSSFDYRDEDTRIRIRGAKKMYGVSEASGGEDEKRKPCRADRKQEPRESLEEGRDGAGCEEIASVMVGTFYAAPSEDAEPFIRVGDTVEKGQTVGIIEAMKLMNEVESECSGTVEEILVKNGQLVEYGQPLVRIRKEEAVR